MATPRRSDGGKGKGKARPPPSPATTEAVGRIKSAMTLEKSFSSSGQLEVGTEAAGQYKIARELMEVAVADESTPRSMRAALEKKAQQVQKRLTLLEAQLPAESHEQAEAMALAAREEREREEQERLGAAAATIQAAARGRLARAEHERQQHAALRIQAHRRGFLARTALSSGHSAEAPTPGGGGDDFAADADEAQEDEEDDVLGMLSEDLGAPPPPVVPAFDPMQLQSEAGAATRAAQPLLQATLRAVSTTASLRQSSAALEYIARCFVAGELLEPPEPDGEEEAAAWSAENTLSGYLSTLDAVLRGAIATCVAEHLRQDDFLARQISAQVLSEDNLRARLLPRIGQHLLKELGVHDREAAARREEEQREHVAALRLELAELKPTALRKRARSGGVSEEDVEQAEDGDDPKAELTELIVAAATLSWGRGKPLPQPEPEPGAVSH